MRMLAAVVPGFLASALLYRRTHVTGFPELARYVLGGLTMLVAYSILHPNDEDGLRRTFLALAATGVGVGAARLWEVLI